LQRHYAPDVLVLNTGHKQIVDADLSGYFDSIPHADLLRRLLGDQ
jgi:hypothetical protein